MIILHLVDEPYDSGIVHYAATAARGLKDRGHEILFCGLPSRAPLAQAARLGLETRAIRALPAGLFDLRRLLRRRRFDVLNAHTGSAHTVAVAATRALRRAPRIIRTRGDSRPIRRSTTAGLLWRRTAGFIAATNGILQEFLRAYPGASLHARAVLPGLPDATGGWTPEPPAGDPPRIGIVGRLDPVKGHVDFLRAAARVARAMPSATFVVAGPEANVAIRHLATEAAGLGLSRTVEFLGRVPDPLEIMRLCSVGVIASTGSEAISRAAIEWMSAGRALVATQVGCLPELVAHGDSGLLVPPRDHEAMAHAILRLLQNPGLLKDTGRRARERYEAHFTLTRFINETEKFYEEVPPSGSRGAAAESRASSARLGTSAGGGRP